MLLLSANADKVEATDSTIKVRGQNQTLRANLKKVKDKIAQEEKQDSTSARDSRPNTPQEEQVKS